MARAPEPVWVDAFIGVGGNLGDAAATVKQALLELATLPQTQGVRQSSLYRTAPVDSSGPDYVNAVAHVRTALPAHELLDHLQALENHAGRQRPYPNAPRTLDLDILLFGEQSINTTRLTVPHPRMLQRAFALVPLAEIAPERVTCDQLRMVFESGQSARKLLSI